jgi:exodeoxyribonuclease VII small subunit
MSEKKETITFEEAIEQLEIIVTQLEEGDVPLEKALDMYQKGIGLSKICQDKLSKVETQMTKLMTEDGEVDFGVDKDQKA